MSTVRPIDTSKFRAELETFLNIYNQSLGSTWGFVPLSTAEVRHLGSQLKTMIVPELALMAEVDGQADRSLLRPVGLQPADQAHQRPAVSLRLYPPAPPPQGNRSGCA